MRANRLLQYFEDRIDPFPRSGPDRTPDTLAAFLWHYARPIWPWLALMSVLTAFVSVLEISLFAFFGNLIDWLGASDRDSFLADEGSTLMMMGAVILIALPLVSFLGSLILHQTVIGNFPMLVRWRAHNTMLSQSYAFYQDEFAGRVATKVMQTSLAVRETVMKLTDVFVYVSVYFLGAMWLVGTSSRWLLLPFAVWLVCYIVMLRLFLPRLKQISRVQADARSDMTGRVVDSYTNIMTVKLFAHAGNELDYARHSMHRFLHTVHPQMRLVTWLNLTLSIINGLFLFAVAAAGIGLWLNELASVGGIAVGIGLVLRLQGMSHWIMWELSALFENIGVTYDGMQMLSKEHKVLDEPDAHELQVSGGQIEISQLGFHYGKDTGIIDELSLSIAAGEKIGLVGRSGAGKTTLTNLLLRLYDLDSGSIEIDGTNIRQVQQESLRRQIGVVTQDTSLLHRSVFENIAYGRSNATLEEVQAAARRANADVFIQDLEDPAGRVGYDAHVGERGVKLSGGQRQRIAIARMFLKDAPILVLDEATSALDSDVEAAIQENLSALMAGKTVIAIAHRLSTIAAMDRLVVMEEGRIIEEGTHDALAASGGLYSQLWSRQSGGFLPTEAQPDRSG